LEYAEAVVVVERCPEKEELFPVKTAAMSFLVECGCWVGTGDIEPAVFDSKALCSALLIEEIHTRISSSDGA